MTTPVRSRAPIDARTRERRREVAREQARRRRRITASVVVAATAAAAAVGLSYTPLFAVADVRVEGAAGEREQQVLGAAGVVKGERLLSVRLGEVASAVEDLPWVRSAEVSRQPPSTVEIEVQPREPIAVVRVGEQAWLVDSEAVVVAGGGADDLVLIDAPEAVMPGSGAVVADPAVRNALAVHRELPATLRAAVVRYDAPSERGLRALLHADIAEQASADGVWVRLGTAERIDDKARVISMLLDQVAEESGRLGAARIAELDVRAPDNPVVVPE